MQMKLKVSEIQSDVFNTFWGEMLLKFAAEKFKINQGTKDKIVSLIIN